MRQIFLTLLFSSLISFSFSQLYKGNKKLGEYYLELKNDSAFMEVFMISPISELPEVTTYDTLLLDKNLTVFNYKGKASTIEKSDGELILLFADGDKIRKIKLKSDFKDDRDRLRKETYMYESMMLLRNYEDSLSGPDKFLSENFQKSFREIDKYSFSQKEYNIRVDSLTKLTQTNIFKSRDLRIDSIYNRIKSIETYQNEDIFNILSSTDFNFRYGKDLIYGLSQSKPETLIAYLETVPDNEKDLLRAIKNHNEFEKIIASIDKVETKSESKKEILKQEKKRKKEDSAVGFIYGGIIAAEATLLVVIIVWFATRLK